MESNYNTRSCSPQDFTIQKIARYLTPVSCKEIEHNSNKAGVLIALTEEAEPKIILTQRALHLSSHAGEIAFPGGKWEQQDTSLWQTALRESREEIDLTPDLVKPLGQMQSIISKFGIEVFPYVGIVPSTVHLTPNFSELTKIIKVPLRFFNPSSNCQFKKMRHLGKQYWVPFYWFEGHKIWGLTAVLINKMCDKGGKVHIASGST